MKRKRFLWGVAALIALAILVGGCGAKVVKVELFEGHNEYVWLQYHSEDGNVVAQGFDHPATVTAEQVERLLQAVHLEELSFLKWKDTGRVFYEDQRVKLASWLADALQKANGDQWVAFAVTGHKQLFFFETLVMTDGLCWVKDGRLHLVLGNVDFELIDPDKERYRGDPRDRFIFNSRRLLSDPAAGYAKPPVVKGDRWLDKERRNWLVFDLAKFAAPAAATAPAPAPEKDDVETRLLKLKDLFEKGLITEDEYREKRKKILEGL